MNILIVGSGGREHAILLQVLKSKKVDKVYVAPGNAGMAEKAECVSIPVENIPMLVEFAVKNKIDLTIIGPELPLTLGVVDAFQVEGLRIFGPSKKASVLEGSKVFTKEFCVRHGIPTAPFKTFEDSKEAKLYLRGRVRYPVVIKADGLAAGKGVIIAKTADEADKAVTDIMLYERFGSSGRRIVIEDFLSGEEASFIVMTNGDEFVEFPASQDHKRVNDYDEGPNTGGMGAYAPAPVVTEALRAKVIKRIISPTLRGLKDEDRPYMGFLYAGLMIDKDGEPQLIEYNCRLGDPEAEVILPLMETDLIALIEAALEKKLGELPAVFSEKSCVGVVLTSRGYPDAYEKGATIDGLDEIHDDDVMVFHSGTRKKPDGFVSDGGRVLVVSASAGTLPAAIDKCYENVAKIRWDGMHYRKDIGAKAVTKAQGQRSKI